jgi:hypothetical protein
LGPLIKNGKETKHKTESPVNIFFSIKKHPFQAINT